MMIKRMIGLFMAVILSGLFIASCDMLANEPKFQTTESGLKYKKFVTNEDQPTPVDGQIITIKMTYGTADTMLFNTTNDVPDKNMKLAMRASVYPGDFYEMMGLMHIGDSVEFSLDPEAFFVKIAGAHSVPEAVKGATEIVFNVKLENVQTEEEVMAEMETKMNEMKAGEADIIKKYIADNNIEATPTESGLYVIVTQEGKGPKPVSGDKVKVHYTGTLLDGTKFDSSVDRGEPFEFPIGQGRVIRGWDEGIAMLNVGSKATLIIPSDLGYGERGAGRDIPPYSTLIFDVELLGISK